MECDLFDEARKECEDRALATAAEEKWGQHFAWEDAIDIVHTAEWRVLDEGVSLQEAADFIRSELWRARASGPKRTLRRLEKKLRRSAIDR